MVNGALLSGCAMLKDRQEWRIKVDCNNEEHSAHVELWKANQSVDNKVTAP